LAQFPLHPTDRPTNQPTEEDEEEETEDDEDEKDFVPANEEKDEDDFQFELRRMECQFMQRVRLDLVLSHFFPYMS